MRVNSDLLKQFEFLTIIVDGTRNFLYSIGVVYLLIRGSSISERGGGEFLWLVQIGRICVVNVCSGIIYQ